jgi:prephenate dehydrogenase
MHPTRLSILGVGLLGGSIGLAVRAAMPGCRVVGYGHRPATLQRALEIGAIDESHTDPAAAVRDADLVILATPVGLFESILRAISPALSPGAIVTDVGSTKRSIVRLARSILPAGVHFVGSHPMAGSEKRGVEFARTDLLAGALCIVTPEESTDQAALAKVEAFWQSLQMRTTQLAPDVHDQRLADISHLPHAVAAALVLMQEEASLGLAGKGFLDTTRIASGDGALWRDIFQDNADNLRAGIHRLTQTLTRLVELLDRQDSQAITDWLDQASRRRDALLHRKLKDLDTPSL